jgi:predicted secreted Zn-dependent protease
MRFFSRVDGSWRILWQREHIACASLWIKIASLETKVYLPTWRANKHTMANIEINEEIDLNNAIVISLAS